jgi:hypothetical protein
VKFVTGVACELGYSRVVTRRCTPQLAVIR